MSIDPGVAWDKLAQFETSQELCEFFKSEGIQGRVQHASECPIATWMHETTGHHTTVAGSVKVWGKLSETETKITGLTSFGKDFVFLHTPATEKFMGAFDCRFFPELIQGKVDYDT